MRELQRSFLPTYTDALSVLVEHHGRPSGALSVVQARCVTFPRMNGKTHGASATAPDF